MIRRRRKCERQPYGQTETNEKEEDDFNPNDDQSNVSYGEKGNNGEANYAEDDNQYNINYGEEDDSG